VGQTFWSDGELRPATTINSIPFCQSIITDWRSTRRRELRQPGYCAHAAAAMVPLNWNTRPKIWRSWQTGLRHGCFRRRLAASNAAEPPQPIARWEFDGDTRDSIGSLHGKVRGAAKLTKDAVVLTARIVSWRLPAESKFARKTLEAWVQLDRLDQRGGRDRRGNARRQGIRHHRRLAKGQTMDRRQQQLPAHSIDGAPPMYEAGTRVVHLAVVYAADGQVQLYRDGQPYGKPYASQGPVRFAAGQSHVVFGLRHLPAGGNKMLAGQIERAQLYDRALSAAEVAASAAAAPVVNEAQILTELSEAERPHYMQLQVTLGSMSGAEYRATEAFATTPRGACKAAGCGMCCGEWWQAAFLPGNRPGFRPPDAADSERRVNLIDCQRRNRSLPTIVNRIGAPFGRGLVETSDLGLAHGRQSPELLDWLSGELISR
jgi:hypothetical protein